MQDTERIERIRKMERCFDALTDACAGGAEALRQKAEQYAELIDYYEGGLWLADYEADERGELPPDLKRGVLRQDGIWNLLE